MIYKDVAEDVEIRFDTSNYDLDRPFPKRKKKVIELTLFWSSDLMHVKRLREGGGGKTYPRFIFDKVMQLS